MAGSKVSKNQRPAARGGDAQTWWQRLGLTRHRVMRPSGRTVMVWMDKDGKEVER